MDAKLLFVFVYLIVDFIYVVLSKPYYNAEFRKVQNADFPSLTDEPLRIIGVLGAYTAMALGWYFLAAGLADTWVKEKKFGSPYIAGLAAGAIYGFALLGTYNFTNYLAFKNYSTNLVIRDITWGTSWAALSVMLYVVYMQSN